MRTTGGILVVVFLGVTACAAASEEKAAKGPGPAPSATAAKPAAVDAWLDKPLENWNAPGRQVPRPPGANMDPGLWEQCKEQNRAPTAPEDRAVAAAGWTLFGPLQTFGKGTMVSGMAGIDGQCRPLDMQTFVFLDGKFAGTVSPNAMSSRSDGAQKSAFLTGETFLFAEFARYARSDPPCCPSRFASVFYKIRSEPQGPVLVPLQVGHQDAPKHVEP